MLLHTHCIISEPKQVLTHSQDSTYPSLFLKKHLIEHLILVIELLNTGQVQFN